MKNTLDYAQELYDQGRYKEAFDAAYAIGTAEDIQTNLSVCLLMAKAYLNCAVDPADEDSKNSFHTLVKSAVSLAIDIEDIWKIECDISAALEDWSARTYESKLMLLKNEPTEERMRAAIHVCENCIKLTITVQVLLRNNALANAFAQENDLNEKGKYAEYLKDKLDISRGYVFGDQKALIELAAASDMYETAMAACEEIAHTSAEYINANRPSVVTVLLYAAIVAGMSNNVDALSAEVRYKTLSLHAAILNYTLTTMVYPNGKAMSLYTGKREDYIMKIQKDYSELAKLDRSFVAPALPPAQAVVPQSGGCYVATAVYGSYDCPQVWTLRRFRDTQLASTWYGRAFIRIYYAVSPTLVKWFGDTSWFKNLWRGWLDKLVSNLQKQGIGSSPYQDKNW